jgi:hypothetical protein
MPEMTAPALAAPEFVDLVCADSALLHAEFEAIVAANFPTPPPVDRPPRGEFDPPVRVPARLAWPDVDYRDNGNAAHTINPVCRQRSPPVTGVALRSHFRVDRHGMNGMKGR